jgi:hypothetical protein
LESLMNTDLHIRQFMQQERIGFEQQETRLDQLQRWVYNSSAVAKTMRFAGAVIQGTFSIASAFSCSRRANQAASSSSIPYDKLGMLVPSMHRMQKHAFAPASYGCAKLYYQGDIPILQIQYNDYPAKNDNRYKVGFDQGYLLGQYLCKLLARLDEIRPFLPCSVPADEVPETMAAILNKLTKEHRQEIAGIVTGYTQWAADNPDAKAQEISINDLILFHLMPDSLHFNPQEMEDNIPRAAAAAAPYAVGCAVVIDNDAQEGLTFGRNMDWPSFGLFGTFSLMVNRKYMGKSLSTVEIGFPGFVGTLTGMNRMGLTLAMNVCSGDTDSIKGMPAAFFNRHCLETCSQVDEVEKQVKNRTPLGSYHLSVADPTAAKVFHIYQGSQRTPHVIRKWTEGNPLVVTNFTYRADGSQENDVHHSAKRHEVIQGLFDSAKKGVPNLEKSKLVAASLTLPYVNNCLTTHSTVMHPLTRKIKVVFDNAFGATNPLQELQTESLFD